MLIDVKIKFFGPLRDIVQREELSLDVPSPCTGEQAFQALVIKFPEMQKWKRSVRLAVNMEYTSFDRELKEGDEICFIPPVSGG
jgi:molybdopterin converting factor subunit 1